MEAEISGIDGWVKFLQTAEIPMLKRTARSLALLQADIDRVSVRAVTEEVTHDPLLTVTLLRYLQQHKRNTQLNEVVQIEQALLMLGMQTFFDKVRPVLTIESMLAGRVAAMTGLLHAVQRATRVARYAKEWAVHLQDLHFDEIHIAALLYNFAGILMWCYAPEAMLRVQAMLEREPGLRTRDAQKQVFGFSLFELQLELAKTWALPEILVALMHGDNANQRQVRIIELAINLTRHVANGWDDPALPEDYKEIGELLNLRVEQVEALVRG